MYPWICLSVEAQDLWGDQFQRGSLPCFLALFHWPASANLLPRIAALLKQGNFSFANSDFFSCEIIHSKMCLTACKVGLGSHFHQEDFNTLSIFYQSLPFIFLHSRTKRNARRGVTHPNISSDTCIYFLITSRSYSMNRKQGQYFASTQSRENHWWSLGKLFPAFHILKAFHPISQ